MCTLPDVRKRLAQVLPTLTGIYPEATFPPVTFLIGRNSATGIPGEAGSILAASGGPKSLQEFSRDKSTGSVLLTINAAAIAVLGAI